MSEREWSSASSRAAAAPDSIVFPWPTSLGDDERALLLPPQRDLLPTQAVNDRNDFERRVGNPRRQARERHAETSGDRLAVAVVTVEQLQHAGGPAKRGGRVQRLRIVKRVDQPHLPLVGKRM
jgi:hypothetical protein